MISIKRVRRDFQMKSWSFEISTWVRTKKRNRSFINPLWENNRRIKKRSWESRS